MLKNCFYPGIVVTKTSKPKHVVAPSTADLIGDGEFGSTRLGSRTGWSTTQEKDINEGTSTGVQINEDPTRDPTTHVNDGLTYESEINSDATYVKDGNGSKPHMNADPRNVNDDITTQQHNIPQNPAYTEQEGIKDDDDVRQRENTTETDTNQDAKTGQPLIASSPVDSTNQLDDGSKIDAPNMNLEADNESKDDASQHPKALESSLPHHLPSLFIRDSGGELDPVSGMSYIKKKKQKKRKKVKKSKPRSSSDALNNAWGEEEVHEVGFTIPSSPKSPDRRHNSLTPLPAEDEQDDTPGYQSN